MKCFHRILGIHAHGAGRRLNRAKLLQSLAFVFGMAALSAQAANVTVTTPNGFAGTDATGSQSGPFVDTDRTFQYVYAASQFAGLAGHLITGMAFRANNSETGTKPSQAMNFAHYDIQLSDSVFTPGNLSTTFANNIGANVVTVRSGALTVPAGSFPTGGNPNVFGFVIQFSTPYLYDGQDLLVTLRHTGQGNAGLDFFMDAINNSLSAVSEGIGASSANGGYTATSIPGKAAGQSAIISAPIIQFLLVPEPASLSLFLIGIVGIGASRRKR